MASTGKTLPGTAQDVAWGSSAISWSNVNNIKIVDSITAAAAMADPDQTSDYLLARNFGFSIPAGSTINGVIVYTSGNYPYSFDGMPQTGGAAIQLYNSGTLGASKTIILDGYVETSAGASNDIWGATLTSAIVNSITFGVVLYVVTGTYDSFPVQADIDYVKMDVFYTAAGGQTLVQSSGGPIPWWLRQHGNN